MSKRVLSIALALSAIVLAGALTWNVAAQTKVPATTTAQASEAADLPRTITVVGKGSVTIKPDIARVNLGVQTFGTSVKAATGEAADIMEAVLAALAKLGIAEKDIQTSGYNVWADTGYGPERSPNDPVIYRVSNNANVTIRNLDTVGTVLDAALDAGANAINGIEFALDKPESLESAAREQAVANAAAKAQELAKLTGVQVGPVVSISEVLTGGYMVSNFDRMAASMGYGGGAGPVTPGELELSMQLQVTYAIR